MQVIQVFTLLMRAKANRHTLKVRVTKMSYMAHQDIQDKLNLIETRTMLEVHFCSSEK